jgi:PAS domain S-box-containing protein
VTALHLLQELPYLASVAISATVAVVCWRRRSRAGAGPFAVVALSEAASTLGFVLEQVTPGLRGKVFWDDVQYLTIALLPVAMLAFAREFTGRGRMRARTLALLAFPTVAFVPLAFTDRWHGLVRATPHLTPGPDPQLLYGFTPVTLAWAAYGVGLALFAVGVITARWIRRSPLYRAQANLVQLGMVLPLAGAGLTLTVLRDSPLRDVSPLTYAAANLLTGWALSRRRLFDLVPLARHTVMESLGDAVYVLDDEGRLVDLNLAARNELGGAGEPPIGAPAAEVLPFPIAQLPAAGERAEVGVHGGRRHLEVSVSALAGPGGAAVGSIVAVRDVSARRAAQDELRDTHARFNTLVSNVPGVVYRFRQAADGTHGFAFVSEAVGPLFGLAAGDVLRDPRVLLDRIHPDDRESFRSSAARSASTLDAWQWRGRVTLGSGETGCVDIRARPRAEADRAVSWDGLVVDVTAAVRGEEALRAAHDTLEQRVHGRTAELERAVAALRQEVGQRAAAEAQLREEESRFRTVVENLSEAVVLTDADGIVRYASERITEVTGFAPAELVGRRAGQVMLSVPEQQRADTRLRRRQDGHSERLEVPITRRDGSEGWLEVIGTPIRDSGGRVVGGLDAVTDVTERRRAARELHAVQERFRLLVETVRDYAIVALDSDGYVVSWNAGAERITGYAAEQILGKPISVFYPPGEASAGGTAALAVALREGRCEVEGWRVRADGSRYWVNTTYTPLRDGAGALVGFAAITRDLTDRVAAEQALRRSEEQLRHSQRMDAVGRLAGGIAHDFNNLLMAAGGHVQLILRRTGEDDPRHGSLLEIRKAVDRAATLTRQLLAFSRTQVLSPRELHLPDALTGMEGMLRGVLRDSVSLVLRLDPATPRVLADVGQLEQVLMNLVVNARDAIAGEGAIAVQAGGARVVEPGGPVLPGVYAVISVTDTGCGIDEEIRDRVFEPFFTTKDAGKGTGLGLSTVYGIVTQTGGAVRVESRPGGGTTFRVYLPALPGCELPAGGSAFGWETVLLAEAEDAPRSAAREALRAS